MVDIKLNFINNSDDHNSLGIVIFQKNLAGGYGEIAGTAGATRLYIQWQCMFLPATAGVTLARCYRLPMGNFLK